MLTHSRVNVIIRKGGKHSTTAYPLISIDVLKNSLTYYNGKRRESVSVKKFVSMNMSDEIPVLTIAIKGE